MYKNIEELNYQIWKENVDDIKKMREREACKMQENLENEKNLELEGTNLSQNDSEHQETINDIIPQNTFEDNDEESYDPFGIVTETAEEEVKSEAGALSFLQESFQRTEVSFETGKQYVAQIKDMHHRRIDDKNMDILDLKLKIFINQETYKSEEISFFFSSSKYCVENSIEKLKELAKKFNFVLKQEDFYNYETIIDAFKHLKETWVKVTATSRIEKSLGQPEKKYMNFEVVQVLGEDYDLGGNL